MQLRWIDDRHSLAIPSIDRQHQELFVLSNQIMEIHEGARGREHLVPVLKKLYAYTHYHFSSEEGIFRQYGYTGYAEHKQVHEAYTERVKGFLAAAHASANLELPPIIDFLVNWIVVHIQDEDRQYADFFLQQGINPEVHFAVSKVGYGTEADAIKTWAQKKLQLEIASIDEQHKELLGILQQANDLSHASEARVKIFLPDIFRKLTSYTEYHFLFEEELMARIEYPGLAKQREQHAGFVAGIQQFEKEWRAGQKQLNVKLVLYLKDWVVNHILKEDIKYKEFVK